MSAARGPLLLVILDGFGLGDGGEADATALARTPFFDAARSRWPQAQIETSGAAVGLPPGQMGNSEVGHMTLGAGRVLEQDMTRISRMLAAGAEAPALRDAFRAVQHSGGRLHLMGLLSDGGVHSHISHLEALLAQCARLGLRPLLHAFLDGRDTPPRSAQRYLQQLRPALEACGGQIASIAGRYWAMDRDSRWERVQRACDAITGQTQHAPNASDALAALQQSYAADRSDEFAEPARIANAPPLADGDAVIFFNFRADRARQLTALLSGRCPERWREALPQHRPPALADFVCFTEFDAAFKLPVAFPAALPPRILGEVIAEAGLSQLRVAETEKYAHVTFFFNCGRETPFAGEQRVLVPSPREVSTYDQRPEMSAPAVTDALLAQLAPQNTPRFALLNYANPDMLGHTGVLSAAVRAVEVVDACLARAARAVLAMDGELLITADHGNCEQMRDPQSGQPHTAHTTNPVPLWWAAQNSAGRTLKNGGLADIAPTILELLELPIPSEMSGRSLLTR